MSDLFPLRSIPAGDLTHLLDHVEIIGRTVWLSSTCRCRTAVLRGVPGKRISVLIDERLLGSDLEVITSGTRALVIGVRVELRRGCFDGAERPNVIVRGYPIGVPGTPTAGAMLTIDPADRDRAETRISITDLDDATTWSWSGVPVHTGPVDDPETILRWHHARTWWSVPLPMGDDDVRRDVDQLAYHPELWAPRDDAGALIEGASIAAWNRAAERALYRLARDRGWRKLTMRERVRLGRADKGAWCDDATYAAAQQALHNARGFGPVWPHARRAPWDRGDVGEYTLDAASAGPARRGFGYEDEDEEAA